MNTTYYAKKNYFWINLNKMDFNNNKEIYMTQINIPSNLMHGLRLQLSFQNEPVY